MKVLITFGTLTGNSETVAKYLYENLKSDYLIELKLQDQIDTQIGELNNFDLVILVASTWGEGEANPITEDFIMRLSDDFQANDTTHFALLGLGDSSYEFFCGVVDQLEKLLLEKKARILNPNLKLDGLPEADNLERALLWAKNCLSEISNNQKSK